MKGLKWKIVLILGLVLLALWSLYPTFRYYTLSPEERAQLPRSELLNLKKKSINLGLDLQGGMYILLEVDRSKLKPEEVEGAVDRAIEVIRNRIDQWGVFEPSIQKVGEGRILVQLPGVLDRERAHSLIGRTAQLEFHLVADDRIVADALERIDEALRKGSVADTGLLSPEDSLARVRPFSSLLNIDPRSGSIVVVEDNWHRVDSLLALPEVQKAIPSGYRFYWGKTFEFQGRKYRHLFLLKAEPELTGAHVKDAKHTIGSGTDPNIANRPIVLLYFDRQGAARFARITGENVGKRLAIVLDNVVQSAPVIQERISGGSAQITGITSMEEAKELAVVLRAGALPAPVRVLEERSVGPLLGSDSIRRGMRALVIGFLAVVFFMALYYRTAGWIADLALFLNLLFILALLVGFHATLTLPGMAGLILTVGIAVDANVLIFERIREELRAGKSLRVAVDTGYKRATITILDANLTTLIAALVLLRYGSGPIRGFAVVLSLGIVVSFFTAIFVTRVIFDYLIGVKHAERIKI